MVTFVEQLESVKESQLIERVHVDIIDGQFVDNITLTPLDLTVVDFGELGVDFHFMVEEPMDTVYECEAITEYLPIKRIIGQVERMSRQADFLHEVKRNGWEAYLGLDLFTSVEDAIDEDVWEDLDGIMLMSIEAGRQEETFNPQVFHKLQELRSLNARAAKIPVIIDGGVKLTNVGQILQHGVEEVSVGSALWNAPEPTQVIEEFFAIAEK
jgi:ribulose-phosphate 3-epimerase